MTCKDIFNGSTGNRATLLILDDAGLPKTGVVYNAAGLSFAYKIDTGSEVVITLTSGNWHEIGGGKYFVDVANSVYLAANLGKFIQFYGALTDSAVYGEQHRVVANNPSVVIAEAVAQYDQRDEQSTPGTIGWYFKKLRQASNTVEAVVTNDITPTATTFSVALTTYPTGAFRHAVLAVVEDGNILDQNSPILTFTNNTTYSTIVLEEAFTQAPAVGNVMLINVISHVHSVAAIAAGVWGATSAAYSAATGTFGYWANAISTMIEYVGGLWRFKATAVDQVNDATINVLPAVGISADRSPGVVLSPFVGETISQSITLYQTDGTTPIVLTGKTLEIVFETRSGTDVAVIANASIVVSGASDNVVTFAYPAAVTLAERVLRFALRDDAAPHTVYLTGICKVGIAPGSDPA